MSKIADEQTRRSSGPGPAQVRLSSQARSELRELLKRSGEISDTDTGDAKDRTFVAMTQRNDYRLLLGEKTMGVGEFVALLGDLTVLIHQIGNRKNSRLDGLAFDATHDHHLGKHDAKTLANCKQSLSMDFDNFVARMGTDHKMIEEFALVAVAPKR
jgi:hypothetical protein